MPRLPYTADELSLSLAAICDLARAIPALEARLRDRLRETRPDGYPAASMCPARAASAADPTAAAALADIAYADPDWQKLRSVWTAIRHAQHDLEYAHGSMSRALQQSIDVNGPSPDQCVSCERIHQVAPVYKARRCRWCYDFYRAQRVDPPTEVLHAHHSGRRIHQRLIRQHMGVQTDAYHQVALTDRARKPAAPEKAG